MEQNFVSRFLPTVGTSQTPPSGTGWSNPSRITADDGSSASWFEGGGYPNIGLIGSSFGIPNLPPGAVVDGIALNIKGSVTGGSITPSPVALNISGSSTKTPVLNGITGGPTDKWGKTTITQSDLTNLTVTISCTSIGGVSNSMLVDCVYVIVYWHIDLSVDPVDVPTRVDYKAYSKDGTYLGLLPNVTSPLAFTQDINSGGSSLGITCAEYITEQVDDVEAILDNNSDPILTNDNEPILAHTTTSPFAQGGSDDDAIYKNGNIIKVWIYNYWYPNGKLIFSGQVNKISFSYGAKTTVDLLVFSDGYDMSQNLIIPVSSFSLTPDVSQTSQDNYTDVSSYTEGAPGKGPTEWTYVAQQFQTGSIERIGAIDLMLQGNGDVTVILSQAGSNQELGRVTQTISADSPTVTRITFNTPLEVDADSRYIWTVLVPIFGYMRVFRSSTDVYANGNAYISSSGPYIDYPFDFYFVTYSASKGETRVTYTSDDPVTEMLSAVLDDYNTRGGKIRERDFDATGLSLTYTFNLNTVLEAVSKSLELSPSGFYAYVDLGLAVIDVLQASDTADFTVVKGRDINIASFAFSIENLKNSLYFSGGEVGGGDNLYREYQDAESIGNFGVRSASKSDGRVTLNATADAIGETFVAENSSEAQETTITIFNTTLDISLFTPGKTIGFRGFGKPIDDMVLLIVRREPNFSAGVANLTLGRLPLALSAEIQKLNKGLLTEQTLNNPDAPS